MSAGGDGGEADNSGTAGTAGKSGDVTAVRIESVAHGGEGVGRGSGRVVFVNGALPGELVEARITEARTRFARAELLSFLEPSSDRLPADCAAASAGAGCCDLSITTVEREREIKADVLREQLQRVGRLRGEEFAELLGGVEVRDPASVVGLGRGVTDESGDRAAMRGWRTVARWHAGENGTIGVRRAGAHDVIAERCSQVGNEILAAVAELEGIGIPAGAEIALAEGADGSVAAQWRPGEQSSEAEARSRSGDGTRGGRGRDRRGGRRNARNRGRGAAQSRRAHAARTSYWRALDSLPGETGRAAAALEIPELARRELPHELLPVWGWEVAAGDFWQPHRHAPAAYATHTRRAVSALFESRRGSELRVWDLYGGAGTLGSAALDSAALSDGRAIVTSVEASPSAVTAGEDAARRHRAPLEMIRADVARWLDEGGDVLPDLVITDPPRAGLGAEVVRRISAAAPARVLHIGCDIAAFSRDVGDFVDAGFRIESIEGIDAFPGTHHAEAVAHLVGPGRG
ncbi:class I SAM-dependent RNA methyltransferase [Dietzia sp.]|uniref:class I SAM-dependent RNA methyltransferase n=1 Tax=Dietzia sp. TaxID=1871616 RepID=UPI002FD9AE34